MSNHLRGRDAHHGHAGLREGQPVSHGVGGRSLGVKGRLAGGQHGDGGGQRWYEGHRGNGGHGRHGQLPVGGERLGGRGDRRRGQVPVGGERLRGRGDRRRGWIVLRSFDRLGDFVQPAVSFRRCALMGGDDRRGRGGDHDHRSS